MEHVFIAVQDCLAQKVTELRWIDFDLGQIDVYELRPPVQFPCALLDLELPECSDLGQLKQMCRCTVTVRIALEQLGQTHNQVNEAMRDKALQTFAIVNKVRSALHGFEGTGFNKLLLRSITTEKREDPLKVFRMTFVTSFTVEKVKEWIEMNVTPKIEGEFYEREQ